MSTHAEGTFAMKSWDEKPFSEVEGGSKLTRASVINTYQGDIEGEGTLEYLMVYRSEDAAGFVGVERVVGRVGDRTGSFVLQHSGVFENGAATATWFVAPGSGTGDLRGMRGNGSYVGRSGEPHATMTLDYDME